MFCVQIKSRRRLLKTMAIFVNFVVKTALIWLVLGGFFCVFSQSETICNLHSCYKFCTRVTSLHSCYGRTAILSQPIRTEYFFSCILLTGISPLALTKSIYYYCCWCCCCYTALYPIKAVYTEKKKQQQQQQVTPVVGYSETMSLSRHARITNSCLSYLLRENTDII